MTTTAILEPTIEINLQMPAQKLGFRDFSEYPFFWSKIKDEILAEFMGLQRGVDFGYTPHNPDEYVEWNGLRSKKKVNTNFIDISQKLVSMGYVASFSQVDSKYICEISYLQNTVATGESA